MEEQPHINLQDNNAIQLVEHVNYDKKSDSESSDDIEHKTGKEIKELNTGDQSELAKAEADEKKDPIQKYYSTVPKETLKLIEEAEKIKS